MFEVYSCLSCRWFSFIYSLALPEVKLCNYFIGCKIYIATFNILHEKKRLVFDFWSFHLPRCRRLKPKSILPSAYFYKFLNFYTMLFGLINIFAIRMVQMTKRNFENDWKLAVLWRLARFFGQQLRLKLESIEYIFDFWTP